MEPAGIGTVSKLATGSELRMVAGVSKGQSLHPSGCKSYVADDYTQVADECTLSRFIG
jgi:hypothetical protein